MTNDKMIQMLTTIISDTTTYLGIDNPKMASAKIISNPAGTACGYSATLQAAAEMLADCYKLQAAEGRPATTRGAQSIVQRLAKAFAKNCPTPAIAGIFADNGRYWICDGKRLMDIGEDLPGAVHANGGEPIKTAKAIPADGKYTVQYIPTPSQIKAYIAAYKGLYPSCNRKFSDDHKKLMIPLDGGAIWVNPDYLLDMVRLYPYSKVTYSSPVEALHFLPADGNPLGDTTEAVLMPMRADNSKDRADALIALAAKVASVPAADTREDTPIQPEPADPREASIMIASRQLRRMQRQGIEPRYYIPDEYGVLYPIA